MKTRTACVILLAFVLALFLGASAEAQLPKQGKYRGTFGYSGVGTVTELDKGHVLFVGEFSGVFFNDVSNGFLDKTAVACPGMNDLVNGVSIGNQGYCIVTDKDGDKAFLSWKGEGTGPNVGGGKFQWIGGTGKFLGLKGDNTYRYTGIGDTNRGSVVWEGEWQLK